MPNYLFPQENKLPLPHMLSRQVSVVADEPHYMLHRGGRVVNKGDVQSDKVTKLTSIVMVDNNTTKRRKRNSAVAERLSDNTRRAGNLT